jgi:biopolymer transport protein ExbD
VRCGVILLVVFCAACARSGGNNGPKEREMVATVTVARSSTAHCSIRWNGTAISQEELTRRGAAIVLADLARMDREVELARQRGLHIETDGWRGPYVRVEAGRSLPYSCFGPALRALEQGGFSNVVLRPAGAPTPDQTAFFALTLPVAPRRYAAIIRLAGGRMTWNGETIDLDGLRQRIRAMNTPTLDDVVVAPSADADFMAMYEAIRVVGQGKVGELNMMPTLSGCAGSVGPMRDPPVC